MFNYFVVVVHHKTSLELNIFVFGLVLRFSDQLPFSYLTDNCPSPIQEMAGFLDLQMLRETPVLVPSEHIQKSGWQTVETFL